MLATVAGRAQILMFNRTSVSGHDPATGAVLWQEPWPTGTETVSQPLVLPGDRVLVSSAYGIGSRLFQLSAAGDTIAASVVWASPRMKSKFANMILHAGYVYGLDDGVFTCLDPATGERRWKAGRYGHGQLLLVDGWLLVQTEDGEVVLLEPSPDEARERGRFRVLDGKTWNPPALSGRYLLVRTDAEAALYELPVRVAVTGSGS
jgi:outer membrane protein assembly factor BamB